METSTRPRNVLIGVDVQNDFIDGSLPVAEGEQVVEPINEVAGAVRESGGDVVFTRDWHPFNSRHFDKWPEHCIRRTKGAEFHPELIVTPEDTIINKGTGRLQHGYSGWEGAADDGTTIEAIITPRTKNERVRVILGSLATDFCVKATGLSIANHYKDNERVTLYLLRDAVRAVNLQPTDGDDALRIMQEAQIIALTSDEAKRLIEPIEQAA